MNPDEILDAYVRDVMRHIPRRDRNDIGLELRGHLSEMRDAGAEEGGAKGDVAAIMAMLQEFGSPEDVASRYRDPGPLIIPAHQTRNFALLAIGGVLLQWALSLPAVVGGQPLAQWWFGAGLGALWWPGFMTMGALAAAWLDHNGLYRKGWKPRQSETNSINRRAFQFGLAAFVIGTATVASLPFVVGLLPQSHAVFFAFDADFLRFRAPLASLLWLGQFMVLYAVYAADGWSVATRRLALACDTLWIALLGWWIGGGAIFQLARTDAFVKSILALLVLIIGLSLLVKFYRHRMRIVIPENLA